MNYIVLDLEWNQASNQAYSDPKLPFEIVEIGAVKLNEDRNMVSEFSRLVKPQVYTHMHQITAKLIHLQMQQLMSGDPFPGFYADFKDWCGDDPFFCTWGASDLIELQRNMRYFDLPVMSKGPIAFLDVQKLYSLAYEDGKTRRALEYNPDIIFCTDPSLQTECHADHIKVGKAVQELIQIVGYPISLQRHNIDISSYDIFPRNIYLAEYFTDKPNKRVKISKKNLYE